MPADTKENESTEIVSGESAKEIMKNDAAKAADLANRKTAALGATENPLEVYSVAATLYSETKGLDDKGITRVAETIRNRYKYYNKNKIKGVNSISYRDIVSAPGQYAGFSPYKNKSLAGLKKFANDLPPAEKKNWNRCMEIAKQTVSGKLNTELARGALGFNKASVEYNKKAFKTDMAFKDDSCYVNNPARRSPHVFFGAYVLSPLKTPRGTTLAKGGNPAKSDAKKIAMVRQNARIERTL